MTEHYRIAGHDYIRDPKTGRLRSCAVERATEDKRIAFREDDEAMFQANVVWAVIVLLGLGLAAIAGWRG